MVTFSMILSAYLMTVEPMPLLEIDGFNTELGCQIAGSMHAAEYRRVTGYLGALDVNCIPEGDME